MVSSELKLASLIPRFSEQGILIPKSDLAFTKTLGSGASGVTHRATYRGEEVAVKVYSATMLSQDTVSVRNELDIMAQMSHENIIEFRGICLEESPPWTALVTRLARRGELGHALHKDRGLRKRGLAVRFRIALGMARGLAYLHANGVIHRDVKPANVLLDEEFTAKLTDFGYSRFIDPSGNMTGETGSYRYMAPEVTRHGKYGPPADVFSFAVVVNEIFTGQVPYEYSLPLDVALGVVKNGVRPSQGKIKNERLRSILARAWDAVPESRPGWDEIIRELETAQREMTAEKERRSMTSVFRRRRGDGGKSSSADSTE